jgi:hypothetical protein
VDLRRPLEANIESVLEHIGRPLAASQIAQQLAEGLGRPPDVLLSSVDQVLTGRDKYFVVGDRWGLTSWLLDLDDQDEEEILFRNFFLDEDELTRFREKMGSFSWDPGKPSSRRRDC